jgi:hypothetical protein
MLREHLDPQEREKIQKHYDRSYEKVLLSQNLAFHFWINAKLLESFQVSLSDTQSRGGWARVRFQSRDGRLIAGCDPASFVVIIIGRIIERVFAAAKRFF